jgi:hypothetical protein
MIAFNDSMNTSRLAVSSLPLLLGLQLICPAPSAAAAELDASERTTLEHIRDTALQSDWGYQRLADLADVVGPRLSGSAGAEAAVEQVSLALRSAGVSVKLDPVKVPHWVRGEEQGQLIAYAGKPAGVSQKIILTALGGSPATPSAGLEAQVIVVKDFDELERRRDEVKGRIVLFNEAFDHHLAVNGYSGNAYGAAGVYRWHGPSKAAQLGAAAVLVRSLGSADFRLPHTGNTNYDEGVKPVPCAAVSVEDALLMERLSRRGAPVVMRLTLTPRTLPDVDSHNVIADIEGSDPNAGLVIISGHLDSWDLGTGAMDDGIGVTSAMAAVQIIQQLGLKPRRTIRFVGWMNEENGLRGAAAYAHDHQGELGRHVAAIESDFGIGAPLGITTNAGGGALNHLKMLSPILEPIGANVVEAKAQGMGSDLDGIQHAGVPIYEPLVDGRQYFDYHHTAADTFDKVDPKAYQKQVAVMAVLVYFLADSQPALPRELLPFDGQ